MRAALIDPRGLVVNVIVLPDDGETDYQPRGGLTLDRLAEDQRVGPGWRRRDDGTYAPPPVRELVGGGTIPPDGETTVAVIYRDTHDDAPAEVTFDVNGTATAVAVTDGTAELGVTSATPGDTITVTVDALPDAVVTITVEEA